MSRKTKIKKMSRDKLDRAAGSFAKLFDWCQRMQDKYPRKFRRKGMFIRMDREQREQFKRRANKTDRDFIMMGAEYYGKQRKGDKG